MNKPKSKDEILAFAIPLFAKHGYSGVSMRMLAQNVGLSVATLYHHFPSKQSLYLATMAQVFAEKSDNLGRILKSKGTVEERFTQFIICLCELISQDNDFNMLLQREMMDGDQARLQFLAAEVYGDLFHSVIGMCQELDPNYDSYLLAISILGMVMYHFQTEPLRKFLPHSKNHHNDPHSVARHIIELVLRGLKSDYALELNP